MALYTFVNFDTFAYLLRLFPGETKHSTEEATVRFVKEILREAMVAPVEEWPELPEGQLYAGGRRGNESDQIYWMIYGFYRLLFIQIIFNKRM